jgi:hypothetical protein
MRPWTAVLALWLVAPSLAQMVQTETETDETQQLWARVRAALQLSLEQETQLRELRSRLADELESVRAQVREGEMTSESGLAQLREAMAAQRQARDEILTGEQRDLLARARRYAREAQMALVPEPQPQRPRLNLAEILELNEEQRARWQLLIQSQRAELIAMADSGLAPTGFDIRRLRREHRAVFESMLTPTQRVMLGDLRWRWQERGTLEEQDDLIPLPEMDSGLYDVGDLLEESEPLPE